MKEFFEDLRELAYGLIFVSITVASVYGIFYLIYLVVEMEAK